MQRHILIVDDRWENRAVLFNLLEPLGFKITETANGQEGLTKMRQIQPDLVITDIAMPVMDGYEATINIRLKDVSIPIIALTASASYGYIEKAALHGINEYILKPFNPKELNLKLRKHFKNILD
jgi:CheY-like chemotaxis protein